MAEKMESSAARDDLREAWNDLMGELALARDAIDQPERMPAPQTARNLAEGYRYLLGFVHNAVERAFFEDARFPFVRHVIQIVNKGTIDNADAIYFAAPIDGRHETVLRGEMPTRPGSRAPQYLIFEASDGIMAGDSGSLMELRPGVKAQTGRIDSAELAVDPDGSFEILLAPERPVGHVGNFVSTHRRAKHPRPDDPDGGLDRYATYLSGRQLFYDWRCEDPVALTLTQRGAEGMHPPAYDPALAAAQLRRMGALVRGQMHFWNQFYTVLLETYGKREDMTGERFMPRNSFNAVNAASGETGGGQSTNLYAGGVYELGPDEALVVTSRVPEPAQYVGFVLTNLWGESHDFANHQASLNGFQAEWDEDGTIRWVVAHRDPGIPNWLDTTGHPEGFMSPRWTYAVNPPKEQWPTIRATKVPFDAIREHLPGGVRKVTSAERAAQIEIRQQHVRRRYRAF